MKNLNLSREGLRGKGPSGIFGAFSADGDIRAMLRSGSQKAIHCICLDPAIDVNEGKLFSRCVIQAEITCGRKKLVVCVKYTDSCILPRVRVTDASGAVLGTVIHQKNLYPQKRNCVKTAL